MSEHELEHTSEEEASTNQQLTESEVAQGVDYTDWNGVDIMESMCMACGETGETRLMLHKIPYFRELVIASFYCDACGERNNEVTFGGEIQLQGCIYELKVTSEKDMDRQIIKSDSASVRIPELDFEIPAMTQRGGISTIEGMLKRAAENLSLHQEQRMEQMPEVGIRVAQIIGQLTMMANRFPSSLPFHIIVDDPAGNSFVENPHAPTADPHLHVKYYHRTEDQDRALGLDPQSSGFRDEKETNFTALMTKDAGGFGQVKGDKEGEQAGEAGEGAVTSRTAGEVSDADLDAGVVVIPTPCPHCLQDGESRTALTSIPHFKEVLIMAFTCKECGYRTNEVKGGGGVPTFGTEVSLTVTGPDDLSRDLLKSDTAMVAIPELELELDHGTLGGMFTTVEGLLQKIVQKLLESNPFAVGDSSINNHAADRSARARFGDFIDTLKDCAKGRRFPFTVTLRDPLGNSFISAPLGSSLPPEMDKNLRMEDFQRTFEEDEELGLNDINTENYGADGEALAEGEGQTAPAVAGPVLPDRLRYKHVKGADHPTPFAKGTIDHDTTEGGMYFPNQGVGNGAGAPEAQQGTAAEKDGEPEERVTAPAGWRAARFNVDLHVPVELDQYESSRTAGLSSNFYDSAAPLAPLDGGDFATKRALSESDFQLKFIEHEEFGGRREGYVYRLGAQGLGYYEDTFEKWMAGAAAGASEQSGAV